MDEFINDLLTPKTKERAAATACTSSIGEFWGFMCRLRSDCKLNVYAVNRPPIRIEDECLRIICRSLHKHFLSQNLTATTGNEENETAWTC